MVNRISKIIYPLLSLVLAFTITICTVHSVSADVASVSWTTGDFYYYCPNWNVDTFTSYQYMRAVNGYPCTSIKTKFYFMNVSSSAKLCTSYEELESVCPNGFYRSNWKCVSSNTSTDTQSSSFENYFFLDNNVVTIYTSKPITQGMRDQIYMYSSGSYYVTTTDTETFYSSVYYQYVYCYNSSTTPLDTTYSELMSWLENGMDMTFSTNSGVTISTSVGKMLMGLYSAVDGVENWLSSLSTTLSSVNNAISNMNSNLSTYASQISSYTSINSSLLSAIMQLRTILTADTITINNTEYTTIHKLLADILDKDFSVSLDGDLGVDLSTVEDNLSVIKNNLTQSMYPQIAGIYGVLSAVLNTVQNPQSIQYKLNQVISAINDISIGDITSTVELDTSTIESKLDDIKSVLDTIKTKVSSIDLLLNAQAITDFFDSVEDTLDDIDTDDLSTAVSTFGTSVSTFVSGLLSSLTIPTLLSTAFTEVVGYSDIFYNGLPSKLSWLVGFGASFSVLGIFIKGKNNG